MNWKLLRCHFKKRKGDLIDNYLQHWLGQNKTIYANFPLKLGCYLGGKERVHGSLDLALTCWLIHSKTTWRFWQNTGIALSSYTEAVFKPSLLSHLTMLQQEWMSRCCCLWRSSLLSSWQITEGTRQVRGRGHRVVDPGGGWRERRSGVRDLLPGYCTDCAGPGGLISVEAQKMVRSARKAKHPFVI